MDIAKRIAASLREKHGATRVLLFGSLAGGAFAPGTSDIDIYFEGVPREKVDEVTGRTMCEFPGIDIDLWPDARCHAEFRESIFSSAVAL